MISSIKKGLITVLFISILLLILYYSFIVKHYVIKHYSNIYAIFGIIITLALLLIINVFERLADRKIIKIISFILIICVSIFVGGVSYVIKGIICDEEIFYTPYVANYDGDPTIILYEYSGMQSKIGCLCIKENSIIYKKIQDSDYIIEGDCTLTDPNNITLTYNPNDHSLYMRYNWNKENGIHEKTIIIDPK